MTLEVIVETLEDAIAAAEGGADRVEVVRDLGQDGLTPSLDLVRAIAAETGLPQRVMVRERNTFDVEGADEVARLRDAVAAFADAGADGVVLGFLRGPGRQVDDAMTREVLAGAPHVRATFHRAFEAADDWTSALQTIAAIPQIDRILTGGGSGAWAERQARLVALARDAAPRITILAGGGIDIEAVRALATGGVIREVHAGRAAREGGLVSGRVSASRVRALREAARGPGGRS